MSFARCRRAESSCDPRSLRLRSFREGDVHVVALAETFDSATMKEVERELMAAEGTDAQVIVLDLRALGFDASGNLRVVAITAGRPPASDSPD
jgi:membrane-bound ClpP family serine protease